MSEYCETCRYFLDEVPSEFEGNTREEHFGFCRRYPPTFIPKIVVPDDPDPPTALWPIVAKQDWCGEYEQRSE